MILNIIGCGNQRTVHTNTMGRMLKRAEARWAKAAEAGAVEAEEPEEQLESDPSCP